MLLPSFKENVQVAFVFICKKKQFIAHYADIHLKEDTIYSTLCKVQILISIKS